MKHLFICTTPLQLMTAINLRISELSDDEVTLYILDHTHLYKEMYEKISNSELFTSVQILKTRAFNKHWLQKYKITRYVIKAFEYLTYGKVASRFVDDRTVYDKFWVSFMDRSSWLIFLAYKKRNGALTLHFFEDGVGSYQLLTVSQNSLDKKLSHLLGVKSVFEEMKTLYLYEPTLAVNTLYPSIEIRQLPKIKGEKIKNLLNMTFSFEPSDLELLEKRYLFFDSPFPSESVHRKQLEIIDFFTKKLGDSFCVKLHPSTKLKESEQRIHTSDIKTSIEVLCLNRDVSDNVFISVLSTVGVAPKLMFGQEPVVIFLYKIITLDTLKHVGSHIFTFIENFKQTYSNPERIFIPESMQELEEILEKLELKKSIYYEHSRKNI